MTWSWTVGTIAPASTHPADDITRLTDALFLLRSNFYGGTAPSGVSIDTCMWWADSTNGLMKMANTGASAFVSGWRLSDLSRPDDQVIWSNAADPTKKAKVDLSAITTGTTRTAKMPNKSITFAGIDDLQTGAPTYAASTNSGNAYSVTLTPAVVALVAGQFVSFKASAANTGAATLNLNGLGAIAIKKTGSTALASGDIANGQMVNVEFDGTNWQLVSGVPAPASTAYTGSVQTTNPSNPTALTATNTAAQMAGLAVAFTPTVSSRVLIVIEGWAANSQPQVVTTTMRAGTGTAPANAAGVAGTQYGGANVGNAATGRYFFSITAVLTGLTPGTPIWADLACSAALASSSVSYSNLNVTIMET